MRHERQNKNPLNGLKIPPRDPPPIKQTAMVYSKQPVPKPARVPRPSRSINTQNTHARARVSPSPKKEKKRTKRTHGKRGKKEKEKRQAQRENAKRLRTPPLLCSRSGAEKTPQSLSPRAAPSRAPERENTIISIYII